MSKLSLMASLGSEFLSLRGQGMPEGWEEDVAGRGGSGKGVLCSFLMLRSSSFSYYNFFLLSPSTRKQHLTCDCRTQYAYRLAFDAMGWYLP